MIRSLLYVISTVLSCWQYLALDILMTIIKFGIHALAVIVIQRLGKRSCSSSVILQMSDVSNRQM